MIPCLREGPDIDKLNARIKQLEEHNRWMMESLEWMVSLGDVQASFSPEQEPFNIFSTARLYLRRLMQFQTLAFMTVNEEDFDFVLTHCEPEADRSLLRKELEFQIEKGHFAWALQQNRSLTVSSRYFDHPLILHPLVTRSNVVGMFAGTPTSETHSLSDVQSNLLTLILFNTAHAIEHSVL